MKFHHHIAFLLGFVALLFGAFCLSIFGPEWGFSIADVMPHLLTALWTFVVAFILFSITVFAHEYGHFLAARKSGLVVESFAIGFGPKIFGWKRDGVEYVLNWLPLGGYVQLPQMAAMDMIEGKSEQDVDQLPAASPWAKMVTAFFGPLFSFLLAVVLAGVVWFTGVPQNQNLLTTTIGYIEPDSPAAKAGIQPGDKIISINGKEVDRWAGRASGIRENILLNPNKAIRLKVERKGQILDFTIVPEKDPELEGLRTLGFERHYARALIIDLIIKNSPAERAGLRPGDRVISLNGQPVYSSVHVSKLVAAAHGPIELAYTRNGKENAVSITPQQADNHHTQLIGIIWSVGEENIVQVSPWTMISNSLTFIYRTLQAVGSPESGVGLRHLSGPAGIFDNIMRLLTIDWRLVLYFGVILNVNLAVINLLPIPILDGGHILFCLVEAIRRRPLEPKLMYSLQMVFFFLIIGLFLFVTFHDVGRIGRRLSKPKPAKFEVPRFEKKKDPPKNSTLESQKK